MNHQLETLRSLVDVLGRRWTLDILIALAPRPLRRNRLRASLDGVSDKVLTDTLRHLERRELVDRTFFEGTPPAVLYGLTRRGRRLIAQLEVLEIPESSRQISGNGTAASADSRPT